MLAITIQAAVFFWVAAAFVLAGAWCASIEIAKRQAARRYEKRRRARGGFLYDRDRDRIGL
jgi:hypothetical protein